MSRYLIDQIEAIDGIEVVVGAALTGIVAAEGHLAAVRLKVGDDDRELPIAALFVTIGQRPRTEWLADVVMRDAGGFVITGSALVADGRPPPGWGLDREPHLLEASVPGVFAAGDVRHRSIKRISSAVGEGAMAVALVHQYLAGL
jgi:thioredoxin reductase (NADPH)